MLATYVRSEPHQEGEVSWDPFVGALTEPTGLNAYSDRDQACVEICNTWAWVKIL